MIKSWKMKWTEHVARKGTMRNSYHIGFWWESQKDKDCYEDLDVGGRIILKYMLEE
jgi:hypothetical protein